MRVALAAALAALSLVGCADEAARGPAPTTPSPGVIAEGWPQALSDWGQMAVGGGQLVLGERVVPYTLNTALFTDDALKLRTVWLPEGAEPAQYHGREVFDFPDGTVITKTFYYPRAGRDLSRVSGDGVEMQHFSGDRLDLTKVRLVETRILVLRAGQWDAVSYVWNDDQTEANLARTGAFVDLTLISAAMGQERLDYLVPNVNQCANCHNTNTPDGLGTRPIGPKARHLNGPYDSVDDPQSQLARWQALGLLTGVPDDAPASPRWTGGIPDDPIVLNAAARAYLDINCAHCHSRTGQADTSGLYLEPWEPAGANLGICKPPIAAGRGTGNRHLGIVPGNAEASIFTYRMASTRADVMMPELGRATVDEDGLALVAAWIDAMAGGCG
jgi:uncharacterized repeat protein (TIGR03806 family)